MISIIILGKYVTEIALKDGRGEIQMPHAGGENEGDSARIDSSSMKQMRHN